MKLTTRKLESRGYSVVKESDTARRPLGSAEPRLKIIIMMKRVSFFSEAWCITLACIYWCVYVGLVYDLTSSYTVGFLILSCVALAALSLIVTVYIIERLAKKATNAITIVIQPQSSDIKC